MASESAFIVEIWAMPSAIFGALVAPKYLWACFWAAVFYCVGKVIFFFSGIDSIGLADGAPLQAGWYANVLGQLIAVWALTALWHWSLKKVHASRAEKRS